MENASKALIIAGAILLSIVLITLGVLIIGRGQETVDQANIDDQVVSAWNQKWTKYEGKDASGTVVNGLINEVITSNSIATSNGETEKVIAIVGYKTDGNPDPNEDNRIETLTTGSYLRYKPDSNATDNAGTKTCNKYARNNAKYTINVRYNKFGYVCQIYVASK